jgi:tryptophan halogenase
MRPYESRGAFFVSGHYEMFKSLNIVVVGGGTAGWMTAAALSKLGRAVCNVTLVESDEIGTVGVGEATIPAIKEFNDYLGVIESEMMEATNATFKLGIEFADWGSLGASYIHPFGDFGETYGGADFIQHWTRLKLSGKAEDLEKYSYAVQACREKKFEFAVRDSTEINSTYSHAYHLDAGLYAKYLRDYSESRGLERIEGKITSVNQDPVTGEIRSLSLEGGEVVAGDLFVDCSGFRALVIDGALSTEIEDWSQWLKCDRAWAVPSESLTELLPYTRATARSCGWQWQIPLQNRVGNGLVFCSEYLDPDDAKKQLVSSIDGQLLAEPALIKFKAGRRKKSWNKNCVAIGLSSGFLEPLESTSIYLIQVAIQQLIKLIPGEDVQQDMVDEFNRMVDLEYDRVRDFLILHYYLNNRDDSKFWQDCQNMDIPQSLKDKIALFKKRGHIDSYQFGLFSPPSWLAVYVGQGLMPENYDPFINNFNLDQLSLKASELVSRIGKRVSIMPDHRQFISDYCAAGVSK